VSNAERLRTRLMVAAQKFAAEVADAVLEATGERDEPEERPEPKKRRSPTRSAPVVDAPADPAAAKRAEAALAKLGIRRAG
jgi:hypothetical protein